MSASLWFFFWPPTWPGTGPPAPSGPTVAPDADTRSRGSGGYRPLGDDYWKWFMRHNKPHADVAHVDWDAEMALLAARLDADREAAREAAEPDDPWLDDPDHGLLH